MALLSWSGSMFEYLMPLLLMPTHEHTLLDETYRAVVARQIEYGRQRGVPWGISESCYNLTDAQAPISTAPSACRARVQAGPRRRPGHRALCLGPGPDGHARRGLPNLESAGRPRRLPGRLRILRGDRLHPFARAPGQTVRVPLRSYMAHHQGMSLLSLGSVLLDQPMQRRFLSDPHLKASELLLCERIPKVASPLQPHAAEVSAARKPPGSRPSTCVFSPPAAHPVPEVHLLSNGRYHVMATNAGGGYSRWNNLAVTRWREDATSDDWGTFCYLRDTATGALWSSAYQPTRRRPTTTKPSSWRAAPNTAGATRRSIPHRNRRFPRGRCRGPPRHPDQSLPDDANASN
jgi:cyclic beta-1,2-glucan synthetase